jgi:hypothetical protein
VRRLDELRSGDEGDAGGAEDLHEVESRESRVESHVSESDWGRGSRAEGRKCIPISDKAQQFATFDSRLWTITRQLQSRPRIPPTPLDLPQGGRDVLWQRCGARTDLEPADGRLT